MAHDAHDLTGKPNRMNVTVGVATRTSDIRTALARFILRQRKSNRSVRESNALAGVSTRQIMAGGRRHVQSESLKTSGLSHWQVANPRLPRLTRGEGLSKPVPVSTTMKSSPSVDTSSDHPLDRIGNCVSDSISILTMVMRATTETELEENSALYGCLGVILDHLRAAESAERVLHNCYTITGNGDA